MGLGDPLTGYWYCTAHKCEIERCSNRKDFSGSRGWRFHTCPERNCMQLRDRHPYCLTHECLYQGCHVSRVREGASYCHLHECQWRNCLELGAPYCNSHRCLGYQCDQPKTGELYTHCSSHECEVSVECHQPHILYVHAPGRPHLRMKICKEHACPYGPFVNNFVAIRPSDWYGKFTVPWLVHVVCSHEEISWNWVCSGKL